MSRDLFIGLSRCGSADRQSSSRRAPHLPTSPHVSPYLPIPPHTSHISPDLPRSPQISRPSELVQTGAFGLLLLSAHPAPNRPGALGLLLLSSALSVSAVLTLRTCLATAPHSLCTHASFAWSRNPICVSSVGLALSLSALLPSVVSAVGTVWLALHLGRQVWGDMGRYGEIWEIWLALHLSRQVGGPEER